MRWRLISGTVSLSYIVILVVIIAKRIGTAWSYAILIPIFGLMVYASYRADEERTARLKSRRQEEK